ncbi:Outer membrane receptor for ferrienterochelin and colicins [Pedobacter westerhofensis]|uniref:Outer membrane receptor for ferrienterochelin and colicins n=1 Tax=Pedobacter westerhofensis TaxID=425512 RepID=A0A521FGB3_9SPHI|nr:outer membrane beta-barrel protein [Pedobacter westerhofensis]SMO95233.1 Outer membrane receptor for ferrienterochelin and colicins [Pedobacter westerhofensis]
MKQLSLILVFFLSVNTVYFSSAQTKEPSAIKGVIIDSLKNVPVGYVTISLQDASTGTQVKSTISKDDGSFEITAIRSGTYKLVVGSIGYQNKIINPLKAAGDLGRIKLKATANQLTEVAVTANRSVIKQEVDRISYDVQSDAESKVLTVLDMLRKVPMVSVDASDNIKLKGTGNYKILINGKESALVAINPADVFKSMPASNIQKIEVITTPPAKYDAEGLAGIINIITKKDLDQGYNVGINTRYNTRNGYGTNLNGTVKQGKFGMNGYIGTSRRDKQSTAFGNQNIITNPVVSSLFQNGTEENNWRNSYGNAELSYEIDTLDLITGMFSGYTNKNYEQSDLFSTELNGDQSASRYYNLLSHQESGNRGFDLGTNYQRGFKRNKEQLLTASYKYTVWSQRRDNAADYLQDVNYNYPDVLASNYKQYNNSGSKAHTMQLDYVHPVKSLTIEAGAKSVLRHSYSDFESLNQDRTTSDYLIDPSQSNHFNYQQNVYGIYNTYQLKLKNWVMKSGLRAERTTIDADFGGIPLNQRYNNFVPSVSVQRKLDSTNNLTLGFTNRIQRPGLYQLNPFINRTNPKYVTTGNPDLQPVTNHTFELNYSTFKKSAINIGLNYAFANKTVESLMTLSPDTVTTTTFANVGKNRRVGIDANTNLQLTKKMSINLNLELIRVWLSGTYAGEFYNTKGYQGHAFTYTTYKFERGYTVGLNLGYDSRYVMLQGRDNEFFFYSGSVQKEILNKKGSISFNTDMPFRKYKRLDFYSNTPDFRQSNYFDIYSRKFNISFNYKFGRLNSEIKKNKRGITEESGGGGRQ